MKVNGPIVFIDDDEEDHMMFTQLMEEVAPQSQIQFFASGQPAIEYLRDTQERPFLIISEIRMNGMNGLELRRQIEQDPLLRRRSIPFIFFTAPVHKHLVEEAYELTIQGFFEKHHRLEDMQQQLRAIVDYWSNCLHPNRFEDNQ
jgi:CheY-like chemotaxis protein